MPTSTFAWLTLAVGLLAQGFFSARILVQWILSERARRVLSPTIFWVLSLAGSMLLFVYGWMRDDFSIIVGQILSYYIYLWNLNMKGVWRRLNVLVRIGLLSLPLCAFLWVVGNAAEFFSTFLRSPDIPTWLLVFGTTGQVIFSLRFLYQWWYSSRHHESALPPFFWIMSLTGSVIIFSYGIMRADAVLMLGQSVGLIAYCRNLWIYYREQNRPANT